MIDTIYAPATAAGRAAVAILRISGPGAGAALDALTRRPAARRASVRTLRNPASGDIMDQAMVLWMPGPRSFTGEDCAELHLHGGPAMVAHACAVLEDLGLRLARPGEFTRRAFEAGRLDLTQAEAVADLVDAETEGQRKQALSHLSGALSHRFARWREGLLSALANIEAAIDFPDEEVPPEVAARAVAPLREVAEDLDAALAETRGERIRSGYRIALLGAPNAGKSTLLNRLAGRDLAIVTEVAGTTRDVLEGHLVLGGYGVVIADMAGLRRTDERVEAEGVRRAAAWADGADTRVLVVDGGSDDEDWTQAAAYMRRGDLIALTKGDLPPGANSARINQWAAAAGYPVISGSWRDGSATVLQKTLTDLIVSALSGSQAPSITRERHRAVLAQARADLRRALDDSVRGRPELAAEDVRLAIRGLSGLTGGVDAEDVLERVFASFCIGK